jgi:hypothetical protein
MDSNSKPQSGFNSFLYNHNKSASFVQKMALPQRSARRVKGGMQNNERPKSSTASLTKPSEEPLPSKDIFPFMDLPAERK